MGSSTASSNGEWREYLQPGKKVWIQVENLDPPAKPKGRTKAEPPPRTVLYGAAGDMFYTGYQYIGTATFLIFTRITGKGKKAQAQTIAINAMDVHRAGLVDDETEQV